MVRARFTPTTLPSFEPRRNAFDAVPAGMKMEPESVYDDRFVLKARDR
jgi:hypothetical protein